MKTIGYLLLTVVILISCSSPPETYTIETIDGVKHIHNVEPLWGDEPKVKLEFVRQVGDLEGNDENYQFFQPMDVAIDESGNLYVVENGGNVVKKFDSSGMYLQTIGTSGQGPGELNWPFAAFIREDGRLYIQNAGNNRIEIFEQDGRYFDSWPAKISNENAAMMRGGFFALLPRQRFQYPRVQELIIIKDSTGTILRSFGTVKEYRHPDMADAGNGGEIVVDSDNNIYIALLNQNRIEKYSPDGDLLQKISRDLPYEESDIIFDSKYNFRVDNIFAQGLQIDSNGRLWVDTFERQYTIDEKTIDEESRKPNISVLEIYDRDGILLTRIKPNLPNGYKLSRIFKDKVYFVSRRDYMDVQIYKIVNQEE